MNLLFSKKTFNSNFSLVFKNILKQVKFEGDSRSNSTQNFNEFIINGYVSLGSNTWDLGNRNVLKMDHCLGSLSSFIKISFCWVEVYEQELQ
jgi:hypothetical protein